ncbi:type II toxin-antitoxin system RelE/ParE family toxin [Tomitella fengzijianii]|uniref:Type II toxin-antitoxin system RelE/ParE family toxin n=1 Tax=Tomitella fengzijianii TaxID=2597660 RepID=A0A516X0X4_9ACTN|nr:type II toxin-antitoxin system RelE/ParE family toxin [Tomitella fengzijianii]QDQ96713.1 type II toxin-antitoxin system RelE/ParE family toxin [Tomitella fengzijianii]
MIRSFADKHTERVWARRRTALPPDVQRRAWSKLAILNRAATVDDLRVPPGNRLEQLKGHRAGQYSIRINRQWRICFVWTDSGPEDVQITDYH